MDLLSPAAMATARRNLSQRIEQLLQKADAAPWQLDQMLKALDAMEEECFADGERTMMKAERPGCAFRRLRPLIPVDRDHLFRSIATSVARVLVAPLDVAVDVSLPRVGQARQEAVPVVNRRDPRATRSALTADAAARVGGPC